tara:strand:+ start:1050 stop:1226 length:177 start_codon:yes stop_codon:yes gene_type:complete
MKKIPFIIILFFLNYSCTSYYAENNSKNIYFSDDLSFEEIRNKLEIYSKVSSYPNLNE